MRERSSSPPPGEPAAAPTSVWQSAPLEPTGPVKASLTVLRPNLPEVVVEVGPKLVIGRAPALCDLVLDDEAVSRRHAELKQDERGYFRLTDLESVNGIRFKDRMVRRLNLVHGDVFFIGATELRFAAQMSRLAPLPDAPDLDPMLQDEKIPVPQPQKESEDGADEGRKHRPPGEANQPRDGLDGIEQLSWGEDS